MKITSISLFTTTALMMICFCVAASITKKSEVKLDSNGRCLEDATWTEDCNTCFCVANGAVGCTLRGCHHLPPVEIKEIVLKEETAGTKEEKCVPGTKWMEDCNSCFCTEGGVGACTEIGCVQKLTSIGE